MQADCWSRQTLQLLACWASTVPIEPNIPVNTIVTIAAARIFASPAIGPRVFMPNVRRLAAPGSSFTTDAVMEFDSVVPIDGLHEGIDISARLGAVIHVIGVLVHVERDHRPATGDRIGVISRPLVDQPLVVR